MPFLGGAAIECEYIKEYEAKNCFIFRRRNEPEMLWQLSQWVFTPFFQPKKLKHSSILPCYRLFAVSSRRYIIVLRVSMVPILKEFGGEVYSK